MVSTGSELPGHSNYFIGDDPAAWRTNVESYETVQYAAVYEGIDLVYCWTAPRPAIWMKTR